MRPLQNSRISRNHVIESEATSRTKWGCCYKPRPILFIQRPPRSKHQFPCRSHAKTSTSTTNGIPSRWECLPETSRSLCGSLCRCERHELQVLDRNSKGHQIPKDLVPKASGLNSPGVACGNQGPTCLSLEGSAKNENPSGKRKHCGPVPLSPGV